MENKINIDLLCPVCRTLINKQTLQCVNNHTFGFDDNVFILLDSQKKVYVDTFMRRLHEIRDEEGFHHIDTNEYKNLPITNNKEFRHEWKLRRYSLIILNRLLNDRKIRSVLEIGPYNGWLSNRMAEKRLDVTAVDYFADELDGLKAAKFYKNKWFSVQMDLRDMKLIKSKFDLVIINHALQFFKNYTGIINTVKENLEKNGWLVLLGLPFFKEPAAKIIQIKNNADYYQEKFSFQIELYPESFKGYLDSTDMDEIEKNGIELNKYPQLFFHNLLASLFTKKAVYYYGTYYNEN